MKPAETLLACCVVGLACFIGGQAMASADDAPRMAPTQHESDGAIDLRSGRVPMKRPSLHGEELLVSVPLLTPNERPAMPVEDIRQRLSLGMDGTYLGDLLLARDSAIARWPDRTTRPLRVFIRDGESLSAWNPDFLPAVRDAFDTWAQAGLPLRFTFVIDSASADVHVRFVDGFANGISGRTVWSRDANYWLVASDIQLAVLHAGGTTVTPPQMRAIALHEVGHLIGLDHTVGTEDIMSARVRVRELSEADRATARLVYAVPAGVVK
ncbi:MAG TPA: hypothetical protein DGD08_12115 [Gemmatimonas aurantiaca]|uniref:Peptidase metallopeptidase domain-containing protein n=2 Tax=Gemmatimonas aurantiaca TaxID=173480 RepID=C1AC26_GEMAT|nr:matrixin family metalloprotease [Gemmatimonas aurantiaca]BAH40053.1 hypothetical protein GAU_3011 [Gemmatimonas aurantiaca T-27]HCT57939.1 hypothetical protein [Gemmatimonas aurantiaca]